MSDTFTLGYALLIGVGESAHQKYSLPVTVKDVQALRKILIDPNLCAYPNDDQHIRLLHDAGATRTAILDGLAWLKKQVAAHPESTVVIYYSGHGWLDQSTDCYYLIPHDIDFDISASALSAVDFTNALSEIQSQRLLVIIDCCHAQGMAAAKTGEADLKLPPGFVPAVPAKGRLDELAKGKGRAVFTSCGGSQKSWIRKDDSMSIYTYHLIEALEGAANLPGETKVGVADIMKHLDKAVPKSASQEHSAIQQPWFRGETTNFPIALLRGGKGLPAEGWEAVKQLPINVAGNNIVHAEGQRSVAIGGRADNSTILPGDRNVVGSGNIVQQGRNINSEKSKDSEMGGNAKSFEPLPGQAQPIASTKYVCPHTDCDMYWIRRSVGQTIPKCSIHRDVELIPVLKS
ncbi:caspase family protein [Lyngbya sp. CCAP 1446/10]|uniref:caspase family protein n=1 Tax=Lyngbya sp. CCAP 1446/10 TaxID=439293 RepID=UPI002237F343|nr:caspase family protein [Lyngbya sp. CCAP 1446/10]MCW6050131.1 caspase family protein [Lyngbya sp. CCAP 1446/10]